MTTPADPGTPMGEMATTFHEFFLSLKAAGFTDPQALYLTGQWLTGMARQGGGTP